MRLVSSDPESVRRKIGATASHEISLIRTERRFVAGTKCLRDVVDHLLQSLSLEESR